METKKLLSSKRGYEMKILMIDKYYYRKGGSQTYLLELKQKLEEEGHEIIMFSMTSEENLPCEYSSHFVDHVDYTLGGLQKIKNSLKLIYSKEAYDKLCHLIEETKPDLAHVNLIYHQLTPAVLHALNKYKIPMVYISHDFKLICPNYKLYHNGVCRKCYGGKYLNCVSSKCHKGSFVGSALVTMEAYVHKWLKSYELLDKIIAPSHYIEEELLAAGIKREKVICLPNFLTMKREIDLNQIQKEETLLYYGRLSPEKGLLVLLEALTQVKYPFQVKIIGKGPQRKELEQFVMKHKLTNVSFLGFMSGEALQREIASAKGVVAPAIWNEPFGLTVIESLSLGTPVIGSGVGAIRENIVDGKGGALVPPNQSDELANKIEWLFNLTEEEYAKQVEYAIKKSIDYSIDEYYAKLMNVYEEVLA